MPKEYKETYMKKTTTLDDHAVVEGYDFEKDFDIQKFLNKYNTTGFQATNLGKAISIAQNMQREKVTTYLSMTGNVISSGLREIITYLVKNKHVDVIVTTASGIEEDVIKTLSDFKIGLFQTPGELLFDHGVGRIGNIFVPNDRYLELERFMNKTFKELPSEITPSQIARHIGSKLNKKSYLYWAYKNNIPVYCPGIIDGSIGDLAFFEKQRNKKLKIDVMDDHKKIINYTLNQEKTGALILGGGIAKHYLLNANIFREGLDYAIYLNTADEAYGSDSGGNEEEAKTWAKISINAQHVKVKADFTITLPLLVAGAYKCKK